MAVTPAGPYSKPLGFCEASIAGSSTFQTWGSWGDADAAKAGIFYGQAPGASALPVAIIYFTDEFGKDLTGGNHFIYADPELDILFRSSISEDLTDDKDVVLTMYNNVGQVITDMEALAVSGGYLDIRGHRIKENAWIVEEEEDDYEFWGRHSAMIVSVRFGGV